MRSGRRGRMELTLLLEMAIYCAYCAYPAKEKQTGCLLRSIEVGPTLKLSVTKKVCGRGFGRETTQKESATYL